MSLSTVWFPFSRPDCGQSSWLVRLQVVLAASLWSKQRRYRSDTSYIGPVSSIRLARRSAISNDKRCSWSQPVSQCSAYPEQHDCRGTTGANAAIGRALRLAALLLAPPQHSSEPNSGALYRANSRHAECALFPEGTCIKNSIHSAKPELDHV